MSTRSDKLFCSFIFGEAIDWLKNAGIVLKCSKTDHGYMLVSVYADLSDFKLLLGDLSMLTMMAGKAQQTILSAIEVRNGFMGVLAGNYVEQAFAAYLLEKRQCRRA